MKKTIISFFSLTILLSTAAIPQDRVRIPVERFEMPLKGMNNFKDIPWDASKPRSPYVEVRDHCRKEQNKLRRWEADNSSKLEAFDRDSVYPYGNPSPKRKQKFSIIDMSKYRDFSNNYVKYYLFGMMRAEEALRPDICTLFVERAQKGLLQFLDWLENEAPESPPPNSGRSNVPFSSILQMEASGSKNGEGVSQTQFGIKDIDNLSAPIGEATQQHNRNKKP